MRFVCVLILLGACQKSAETPARGPAAAIAHGGVGSPPDRSDGCRRAVDAALAALEAGADPRDAVVAGIIILEDDPRFNAGTGSRVRLDGKTVQMDASLMDSTGRFAAVAALERVQNPIKVARAVMDTPHTLIVGDGATRFARTLGLPDYDPSTEATREIARKVQQQLREGKIADWKSFDWRKHWNFEIPWEEAMGHDTVGVAVRTADGRFAVGLSTGGTAVTLRGRVGDVPIFGAGLYTGEAGASAATGAGERIVEAGLGRRVHDWLSAGDTAQKAAERAVELVKPRGDIGIIVIGRADMAAAADRSMAWAARTSGEKEWKGP